MWRRTLDVELAVQHVCSEVGERLVNHVLACPRACQSSEANWGSRERRAVCFLRRPPRLGVQRQQREAAGVLLSVGGDVAVVHLHEGKVPSTQRVRHARHSSCDCGSRRRCCRRARTMAPYPPLPRLKRKPRPLREASLRRGSVRRSADAAQDSCRQRLPRRWRGDPSQGSVWAKGAMC